MLVYIKRLVWVYFTTSVQCLHRELQKGLCISLLKISSDKIQTIQSRGLKGSCCAQWLYEWTYTYMYHPTVQGPEAHVSRVLAMWT